MSQSALERAGPSVVRYFARLAGRCLGLVLVPEVDLPAIRQDERQHVAIGRLVARARDDGRVRLACLEDIAAADADIAESAGTGAGDRPRRHLAALVLDVQEPADVRIDPQHLRQHAGERGVVVLVERGLDGVMGPQHPPPAHTSAHKYQCPGKSVTHLPTSSKMSS